MWSPLLTTGSYLMKQKQGLGIFSMLVAALAVAAQGILIKIAASSMAIEKILVYRFAIAFVLLGCYLLFLHRVSTLIRSYVYTRKWWVTLLSSLLGVSAMGCYFFSLKHLPLSIATALFLAIPLFLPWVHRLFYKTPLNHHAYLGMGVIAVGVLCIMLQGLWIPVVVGLASAALLSLWIVCLEQLHRHHTLLNLSFHYFGIGSLMLVLFYLLWGGSFELFQKDGVYYLVALGLIALVSQLFFTLALRYAPASKVMPWMYASLLLLLGIDEWGFQEAISVTQILGMVLLVIGSVRVMHVILKGFKKNV